MKQLFLLRHAKSSWDDPSLADRDRPLAPRGRRAAGVMADHLRRERIQPSLVLCSSATRARETMELVAPGGEVSIETELYGASADGLLDRLRRIPDTAEAAMLIGHEPAIRILALTLAGAGSDVARIQRKFPTGALATFTFSGSWKTLRPGGAELIAFVRPKELD